MGPQKIRWIAPDNAFADLIVELKRKGYIAAGSDMEALSMAAPHFENVNQDAETLWKGLKNKDTFGNRQFSDMPDIKDLDSTKLEGKFSEIPPAKKRRKPKNTSK